MKHPQNRAERRHNGVTWRNRQRAIMRNWYREHTGESAEEYWAGNRMWHAKKQTSAHGNRCMCHYEKRSSKEIAKRRRALDQAIVDNIREWLE